MTVMIDGVEYVPKALYDSVERAFQHEVLQSHSVAQARAKLSKYGDTKRYMVRTTSAGVFFGEIIRREGKEVEMSNARRVWSWAGAASLSQLATDGTSLPDKCKLPCSVDGLILTEVIEIIPCTEKALQSLDGVQIWKL